MGMSSGSGSGAGTGSGAGSRPGVRSGSGPVVGAAIWLVFVEWAMDNNQWGFIVSVVTTSGDHLDDNHAEADIENLSAIVGAWALQPPVLYSANREPAQNSHAARIWRVRLGNVYAPLQATRPATAPL